MHGDVFRPATSPLLFSALIGSGAQLAFVIFLVVVFTIMGELYTGIKHFHSIASLLLRFGEGGFFFSKDDLFSEVGWYLSVLGQNKEGQYFEL